MVTYPDVTLLIQGPINDKTIFYQQIPYYKTLFEHIILSTYTEQLNDKTKIFCLENGIDLVHQTNEIGNLTFLYNIGHQTVSTLLGLKHVSTPYTLKHRTDEYYSNLDKLIDLFLKDTGKWVCGSTIFGNKAYYPYHAADHLFIARTDKLINTFELTLNELKSNIMVRNQSGEPAAELTFTKNYIRINGVNIDTDDHDTIMKNYFNIVNDTELFPFLIRFNSYQNSFYDCLDGSTPNNYPKSWRRFKTMDDILTLPGRPDIYEG